MLFLAFVMLNDHGISGHVFLISGHVFLISGHVGPPQESLVGVNFRSDKRFDRGGGDFPQFTVQSKLSNLFSCKGHIRG